MLRIIPASEENRTVTNIPEWLKTDQSREVIETPLAHVVGNRVEAAYSRSDLFERRRVLMDDWARYLAQGSGEGRTQFLLTKVQIYYFPHHRESS